MPQDSTVSTLATGSRPDTSDAASEQSFHNAYAGNRHTFAETSADEKLDWIADYLEMLGLRAFSAEVSGGGEVENLGHNIEMAKKFVLQARRQVVAENNALHERLAQHGDYVVAHAGHDLRVYFELDGPVSQNAEPAG